MNSKILFTVFAILAAQSVLGDEPFPEIFLRNFQSAVNQSVEGALQTFDNSLKSLTNMSRNLDQEGVERVKNSMKTVTRLVEECEKLGIQVADCVKSSNMEEGFIKSLGRCLDENVEKGKSFVVRGIGNVRNLHKIFWDFPKKISKCEIFNVMCFFGETAALTDKSSQAFMDINKEVVEVGTFLASIEAKLVQCVEKVALTAADESKNITRCVENKRAKHQGSKTQQRKINKKFTKSLH